MNDNKLETLIVPNDLGKFLDSYVDMIGDDSMTFEIINDLLEDYHDHQFQDETRRFIYYYMTDISEVISGKREYVVAGEDFYY